MNWLEGMALLRLVGLIAILGWLVFGSTSYIDNIRRSRFKNRPPLADDLFYERYYGSSGLQKSKVIDIRHEIEAALNLKPETILPSDRFSEELSAVRGREYGGDRNDELYFLNRDREKRLGVKIPLAKIKTADDYIRTIVKYV
jgi:hypothetical protein